MAVEYLIPLLAFASVSSNNFITLAGVRASVVVSRSAVSNTYPDKDFPILLLTSVPAYNPLLNSSL